MKHTTVQGYPFYTLYEDGRMYSQPRQGTSGGWMEVYFDKKDKDAYPSYYLRNKGKAKRYKIHQLLAQHFIPNPQEKPLVLHRDDNRLNYQLDNLYWGDWSQNLNDSYYNGRRDVTQSETF